jgi:hypothetical protein
MEKRQHSDSCPLYPAHWLRHAIAAVEHLVAGESRGDVDRLSAAALLNALDYYGNHGGWEGVTLLDVAEYATLMSEDKFGSSCMCKGRSTLKW